MSVNQVDLDGKRLSLVNDNLSVKILSTPNNSNTTTPLNNDKKSTLLTLQRQYIFSLREAVRLKKLNGDCVLNNEGKLFCIQIKNPKNKVVKAYILNDTSDRIISVSDYNPDNGKVFKTVLYSEQNLNVSSVQLYDKETGSPMKTTFFKEDGKTVSSILEYSQFSDDIKYTLICDDGETITEYV